MSNTSRTVPAVEATAVLILNAPRDVSRKALEEATFQIERTLGERVADLAPGASACADFEDKAIEIDVSLTGDSPTELHRHLATIIDVLERHCALDVHEDARNRFTLTSSTTRMARSHSVAA
jgi:ethanolamine utilization microcompartment shell protein EutL